MKKPKQPKGCISSILIFNNGNIAVFDHEGNQVYQLQKYNICELIRKEANKLGYDTKETEIKFQWNNHA